MKRKLLAVLLLLGALGYVVATAWAQPPLAGLDVLFVVDQSGSMGGSPQHPEPNDPNQLRFYAPIHAMRWLGSDRVQVHTAMTYRMGVLHFGDRVQPGLGWQAIAPADAQEWETEKTQLADALAFDDLRTSDLGGTDFLLALKQARQMFDRLPPDPSGPHRQAVIILTDGEPSVPGQTAEEHMQDLRTYMASNFPTDKFTTCVIAMNDVAGDYWTRMRPFWQEITENCAVKVVSNETDVGGAFRVILRQLTGDLPHGTPTEEVVLALPAEIVVPPYLQSIAFTLDKADPQADKIAVEVLEGDPITFDSPQVQTEGANEPIETITIYDPPPGRWLVRASEGATLEEVDMRKILPKSVLLSPTGVVPVAAPVQVEYQIQTSEGHPLEQYTDPRYRLEVKQAEVVMDGTSWPLEMTYDAARNAFVADFTPPRAGTYAVRLSAVSRDIEGQAFTVFPRSDVGAFLAGEPELIQRTTSPDTQPLYQPRRLAYAVEIAGESLGLDSSLSGVAVFESGTQSWTVPLTPRGDGELKGEFTPVATGSHRGDFRLRATSPGGQQEDVYRETLSPFSVIAPQVTMDPPDLTQHCAGDVVIEVDNGLGHALVAPPDYTLSTEAILADGSSTALAMSNNLTYRGQITPVQHGAQTLDVELMTRDPDGVEWQTYRATVGRVQVARSTGLRLEIVEPADGARLPARTPKLEKIPLTVTLTIRDETGQAVDPTQVMEGDPLQLEVQDEEGRQVPVASTLIQTGKGRFQAVTEDLAVGEYKLTGKIVGQPVCGYHLASPSQVTQTIRRTESIVVKGLKFGGPVVLLSLIVGIVLLVRRQRQRRQHPCKGRVVIIDKESGRYIFNKTFPEGRQRRNRFVYKGRKLGPQAKEYFSRMEFTCTSEDDSERRIVNARIFDLGGEEVLDAALRPSRSSRSRGRRIRRTKLYIYKDPMDR